MNTRRSIISASPGRREDSTRGARVGWVSGNSIRLCPPYDATIPSHRLQQHMLLLAERQLDHAFRAPLLHRQHQLVVGDSGVVDLEAARLDLAARLAVRRDQAGSVKCRQHAKP